MNHRTGLDRSQTLLFPERLEDYVAAENPVRFLDAFVGMLCCPRQYKQRSWIILSQRFHPSKVCNSLVWVHARSAQGTGESKDGMESDDANLQPQTSLKSGELRETDGSGRSKSPAKSLNRGGGPFFHSLVR